VFAVEKESKHTLIEIIDCGLADYREILARQHELCEKRRRNEVGDTVLVVEHPAVITLGARRSANRLVAQSEELSSRNIEVVNIRRGGGATAHNPGQLVFYPIVNLRQLGLGINEYVRKLEQIGIELLASLGVQACRRKAFPGLWVGEQPASKGARDATQERQDTRKIASVGVRVSRFITHHGMAINIQNDLSIFELLVPCGLDGVRMTSVLEETGRRHSMDYVKQKLSGLLTKHFSNEGPTSVSFKGSVEVPKPADETVKRLPSWLRRRLTSGETFRQTEQVLSSLDLQTICSSANCPNRGQCWDRGTATVLILGDVCTRNCGFCSVATGRPGPPDPTEPARIAEMAERLNLKYLVLTSVNRDDLPDGGAAQFRDCINRVRSERAQMGFEILTPDFRNCQDRALRILREALPFVFAHNVETVPSLYPKARAGGDYQRSLNLLRLAKETYGDVTTKSSLMLGLGESDAEVEQVMRDLREVGCERITIGQYLKPSPDALEVVEYVEPERFQSWKSKAIELGFRWVISAPYARSSYFAEMDNTGEPLPESCA